MSFPAPHTYVPATAPVKRGPSLRVSIPSDSASGNEAVYRKTLHIANLSLSAAIKEVSKQPLPAYGLDSWERALCSGFAMEHSGDEGHIDYLHWSMVHNRRPEGPWEMCACENPIIELPDEDEDPLTNDEWNRRMYDNQDPFGLPVNREPSTANINSAILTSFNGSDSQSGSLQEADTVAIAIDQENLPQDYDGAPTSGRPTPSPSLNPLCSNPAEPSFQIPFPSEIQASSTDQFEQPASQLNANAEEFVPNLRGGNTPGELDAEGGRIACSKSKLKMSLGLWILIIVCAIGAVVMIILLVIFYTNRKLLSG